MSLTGSQTVHRNNRHEGILVVALGLLMAISVATGSILIPVSGALALGIGLSRMVITTAYRATLIILGSTCLILTAVAVLDISQGSTVITMIS